VGGRRVNVLLGTLFLWAVALWLYRRLGQVAPETRGAVWDETLSMMIFLLPRILIGILGAGYMAEMLPTDRIEALFGDSAGMQGVALASLAGVFTPSGPFIAFAVGAAAVQAGAGTGAVLAYVTAWSVICLNRAMAFELPMMGRRFVLIRSAVSLPLPFVLGAIGLAL